MFNKYKIVSLLLVMLFIVTLNPSVSIPEGYIRNTEDGCPASHPVFCIDTIDSGYAGFHQYGGCHRTGAICCGLKGKACPANSSVCCENLDEPYQIGCYPLGNVCCGSEGKACTASEVCCVGRISGFNSENIIVEAENAVCHLSGSVCCGDAGGACDPGKVCCGTGKNATCNDFGSICCGEDVVCNAGQVCCKKGEKYECIPQDDPCPPTPTDVPSSPGRGRLG